MYRTSYNQPLKRSRLIVFFAKLAFLGVIGLFLISFVILPLLAYDLPSPDKIVRREGFSTKILDRNAKVLYDIYSDQKRIPITIDQAPKYLRQAPIALEDKNFYKHKGFDPVGIF
ncbi:MAG: transglycosylase domain-containing protein, partial [Patescibacteria group bacterium]